MNQFIANLIPRLRQYGQQLSKIESFVDKTWCLKDEHDRLRTYRFKRNNTLRVSIAGNFADMHWELEGLDALAISSHGGKSGEIYRHGFVFDGLLIVQKEGTGEMPKIFYDESKVPDGDVLGYIRRELISRMGLRNLNATSNLFVTNSGDVSGGIYVGQQVYDHNIQLVKNQTIKEGDKIIFVRNGLIEKIITIVNMVTDYGEIQVHTKFGEPGIGDFVYMHGTPLQSGRYIAKANSSSYNIDVANGSITKVFESIWTSQKVLLILLVVVILTVFMIAVNQKNNPAEAVIDVKDTGQVQEPIDTAALSVDTAITVSPILETLDESKQSQLKSLVIKYFESINNRDWNTLANLLHNRLTTYNDVSNINSTDVLDKLRLYWGADDEIGAILNEETIKFNSNGEFYSAESQVIELGYEGFYKTPILLLASTIFEFNSAGYITTISTDITHKKWDIYRMFDLDKDISIEDYSLRNNPSDWEKCILKIKSISKSKPSELPKYKEAILELFGSNCIVVEDGTAIGLEQYVDLMAKGIKDKYLVSRVSSNDNNGKYIYLY